MFESLHVLNASWAWAVPVAAAVPWIAHLLSRRSGRRAEFPAARFLAMADETGRRRVRLRDLLLLLLRALALIALVAAFTRPVWSTALTAVPGQPRLVVFLLDRSASMTRTARGVALWEQARRDIAVALSGLDPSHDRAAVVLVDAAPASLLPEPTAAFTTLAHRLEAVGPTHHAGGLAAAMALTAQLRQGDRDRRGPHVSLVVHVHTDMQATQIAAVPQEALSDARVVWHALGQDEPNLALRRASLTPASLQAGQPALFSVEIANASDVAQSCALTVRAGKGTVRREVSIGPRASAISTFPVTLPSPGTHTVSAAIEASDDAMSADNATGVVVAVRGHRRYLVVTADAPAGFDHSARGAFYVLRAMYPSLAAGASRAVAADASDAQVYRGSLAELPTLLSRAPRFDAVVLVDAGRVDDPQRDALRQYVSEGGVLHWGLDSPEAMASFTAMSHLVAETQGQPLIVGEPRWIESSTRSLNAGDFDHPSLSVFEGAARSLLLRQGFAQSVAAQPPSDAHVLLRYDDQQAALWTQWLGAGRLVAWTWDLAPGRSDMVKQPVFAPLIQQLVRTSLPESPTAANPVAGSPIWLPGPAEPSDAMGVVVGPDGERAPSSATTIDGFSGHRVDQTVLAGLYRVVPGEAGAGGGGGAGVFVEVDPSESDLRLADAPRTADPVVQSIAPSPSMGESRPLQLWPWLIGAGAALLGMEQAVLWWMTRASRPAAGVRGGGSGDVGEVHARSKGTVRGVGHA